MASLGMSAADREAIEAFKRDVVDPSMNALVILDFWAEWCGPCKALTPILEKVAAKYAGQGVMLAKINVDENKLVAAQFRVQSIPTVYAMFQGQLVADLTSARTEGQLSQMLDQILRQLPIESADAQAAQELEPLIAMGEEVLEAGEVERAISVFEQVLEMAPDNPEVIGGLARALLAAGEADSAEAVLATAPEGAAKHAAIARAQAAVALAREATPVDDLAPLVGRIEADPDDHQARYDLAGGLMARGDRDAAADQLLELIRRDRAWNEGAGRARLLKLFESIGLEDPWVSAQRRRLSAVLFT